MPRSDSLRTRLFYNYFSITAVQRLDKEIKLVYNITVAEYRLRFHLNGEVLKLVKRRPC